MSVTLEKIVALAKRRGFVFPNSEIYGGLANTYDYGSLGVELLRNIKDLWWRKFVHCKPEIIGLDTAILMSPRVWEASGHIQHFKDAFVDCKKCKLRIRADHLIENFFASKNKEVKVEGLPLEKLEDMISSNQIPCPECKEFNWTKPRHFNLLFETKVGLLPEKQNTTYLRGEIAQGMFVNFKNVINSLRILNPNLEHNLPFGIAQQGKAFRNEITKGNFIFRTLEFNLAEIEYFFNPQKDDPQELFLKWKKEIEDWTFNWLKLPKEKVRWREHTSEERAFYSQHTEDLEFEFPFGFKELYGLAYRTDYDLKRHSQVSGEDLSFKDPKEGKSFIPHVIEPTFGLDRTFLALLSAFYKEEKGRIILSLPPYLAPFQVAVFPLLANKSELVKKAKEVFELLICHFNTFFDSRGNIGKRYYYQDEIGTPFGVTVDFQTLKDNTVTLRDRDTTYQERVKIQNLISILKEKLKCPTK